MARNLQIIMQAIRLTLEVTLMNARCSNPVAEAACSALRWAAFGGRHRGLPFTCRPLSDERWRFETEYGNKAWFELELPATPLSLLIAGAVLLQQLNSTMG